ncbi:hypothetical protein V8E53_008741 [Lactarius tabidus]
MWQMSQPPLVPIFAFMLSVYSLYPGGAQASRAQISAESSCISHSHSFLLSNPLECVLGFMILCDTYYSTKHFLLSPSRSPYVSLSLIASLSRTMPPVLFLKLSTSSGLPHC